MLNEEVVSMKGFALNSARFYVSFMLKYAHRKYAGMERMRKTQLCNSFWRSCKTTDA